MGQDPKVLEAITALKKHFVNAKGEPIRTPYYHHQLQVFYEDDFYDWIVSYALKELIAEKYLVKIDSSNVSELKSLRNVSRIKFYANAKAVQTQPEWENMKTHVISIAKLVDEYSDVRHRATLGKQLESLVKNELRAHQFDIISVNTKKYNGKEWTKTDHNLDIIAKKKNSDLVIGVEVKNTQDIIPPSEIDVKIDICEHLGIIPVFAVRWIKPYTDCIRRQGGFCWVFKTQIFPFGYEDFTKTLYQRLSELNKENSRGHKLEFPITVRNDLPEKSVNKFEDWLRKIENNPPTIDTSFRCGAPEPEPEPDVYEF
ncbi:MAG: hypothetical protein QXN55_06385 [Candidatus Nitrosotenuis sp.]